MTSASDYVGGGSEATCRLLGLEGELAKRRVRLSDSQKESLYRMYLTGETAEDLAAAYDISVTSVYKHIKAQREREGSMAQAERVIAGDKTNGRLVATDTARHRFDGTHLTADGEMHRWKFTATGQRMAVQQYEKWCKALDDECEFMRKAERKVDAVKKEAESPFVPTDEHVQVFEDDEPNGTNANFGEAACGFHCGHIEETHPVEPAPVPEIEVRPWRDVAEERQRRIEELEKRVVELHNELETAKTQRIEFAEGFQLEMHNPSYLLWSLVDDKPRFYGLYLDEDEALSETDRLNEVAAFLGSEGAFEVEEVAWRM